MELEEKTLGVRRGFTGRAIAVDILDVELPDGRRTVREVVRHGGAAAVLGQCPDGRFVFIRQYRKAVGATLLEVAAGCMEPGESPEECARREMKEETGYPVLELEKIGILLPSPGYAEERIHLFYAKLPPNPQSRNLDSDENLQPVHLSQAAIESALDDGTLTDGKSIAIWLLWLRKQK